MTQIWDSVIVGGSAAGLSAALMLGRSRRSVLIIDAGEPRNRFAEHMHGVLGHDGADPAALLRTGRVEVERYGVTITTGRVDRVDGPAEGPLTVTDSTGTTHQARAVIVATGTRDVLPDIPGLADHWGTAVIHCPYCDGWEVRDQRVGVLVTSPGSAHQAQLARQLTDQLTVFTNAGDHIDAPMLERLASRNVTVVTTEVTRLTRPGPGIVCLETTDGAAHTLDALFVATELQPLDHLVEHLNLTRVDLHGTEVLEVDAMQATSHPRIWAAGNVVTPLANVPMAMAAGATAGAAVNAALTLEDFDHAHARAHG